ncbi:MAG TPA: hypothetical protein VEK11_25950 [Thermoanaerobaculia bacterium]|jgi:hypothetical protein|nr:hypothetical protein [Thermoanaerobaculia bacterium]
MTLEEFETQIMAALLAGEEPILKALRVQYAAATVRDRERTATGFVTRFEVPPSAPPIERKLLHLDDLQVELEGVSTPVDASVHVFKGKLQSLECFVYDGTFPDAPSIQSAWYYGTKKFAGITPELMAERDVEELLEDEDD